MFKLTKDSLPVFNSFKFKNLKSMDTSDGVAYTCELFYKNQKIADVADDGRGGMTDIDYANGGEELLNSLDVPQYFDKNEDLGFDIDNEYIIADLCEVAIWLKSALRNQSKSLVVVDGDEVSELRFKVPFTKFAEAGKMDIVLNRAKELEKEGKLVINTNLSKFSV